MMYDGEYITETFVNFYRYVSAHSTEYPAGHLVELPPITASALGV